MPLGWAATQNNLDNTLSTEKGTVDPWMDGKDKIGNQAKEALLTEAVGFANAYGGAVLLGIRESKTKPPVAAKIAPIQRCADLAERLKLVFRDCVEQQLPRIDIFAVPTEGESGVVIIRVGQSRLVSDHRKTYFFGLSPTGHRSRQPRLWRGIGGNGSVQRLNRPQIEHRQRVGERRGAGELIVPPP